jgi:hypothetical protein
MHDAAAGSAACSPLACMMESPPPALHPGKFNIPCWYSAVFLKFAFVETMDPWIMEVTGVTDLQFMQSNIHYCKDRSALLVFS